MSWNSAFVLCLSSVIPSVVVSQCATSHSGCQLQFAPVCDNRGTTYLNPCWFSAAQCRRSVEGIKIERSDCNGVGNTGSSYTSNTNSLTQIIQNPSTYPSPYVYYNPIQSALPSYMALPPSGCNLMTLRPELDSRWAQLMQNLQIGNPQAIADLFSRDIVYVTPDLPTIRNSSVINDYFKALIQGGLTNWENFPEDVICFSPEWAFERGYHKLYSAGNILVKVARHTVLWKKIGGLWQFQMLQITEDCATDRGETAKSKKATKI